MKPIEKMKLKFFWALMMCIGFTFNLTAQAASIMAEYKVAGNCGMCEKIIEKAAKINGVTSADWNMNSKILSITYSSKKTSADAILKKVAYAGYDNEKYLAPDEAYSKLHECCKYERTRKKEGPATEHKNLETKTEDYSAHQQQKNELENVYALYFDVKDALINDDSKQAGLKSKNLLDALENVKMEKLGTKEHEVFMKDVSELKTDAGHIAESKDIEHQREHFISFSAKMYELMKIAKPSYAIYFDHCPMYNDGKGADWISKESAIKNPYFGSKMLTCGKVKETIK